MQTLPPLELTPKLVQRFWRFVTPTEGDDACWEWEGHQSTPNQTGWRCGLIKFKVGGTFKRYKAHRVGFLVQHGYWPENLVCHTCDNPMCVRGGHLFEGTQADNIHDMWGKGRASTHLPTNMPRGEDHHMTKITWERVCALRDDYANNPRSVMAVSRDHGMPYSTVRGILRGETWLIPRTPSAS